MDISKSHYSGEIVKRYHVIIKDRYDSSKIFRIYVFSNSEAANSFLNQKRKQGFKAKLKVKRIRKDMEYKFGEQF